MPKNSLSKLNYSLFKVCVFIGIITLISSCASTGKADRDPLESFNRVSFKFNEQFDKYTSKPLAQAYGHVVPKPIQSGIHNFIGNVNDVNTVANGLLQLNIKQASSDFGRLIINSTLGLVGIFDVAKHMGMPKHQEDFGQTLAVWGVPEGPYVMIPILGARTLRSLAGGPFNALVSGNTLNTLGITTPEQVFTYQSVAFIDKRKFLLPLEEQLNSSGVDPYIGVRENYLAKRALLVSNGKPQTESSDYDDTSFMGDEDLFEEDF